MIMIGSLLPWITMSSQSWIFKGALHLCFAVSERASEIPSCYILSWLFWEVLSSEVYYYCSLVDYAIDVSSLETWKLLWMWLVHDLVENLNASLHIYNNKSKQSLSKFFFITFSLSTELLEDKQRFKLGGVDTSPTYLLFLTLFVLFWTLICMIWMKLTPD